ncbi:MAG TPA: NUDIX domain-containing protein [Anaeromyxobacteraceae bacterium]|nr:NUDIX domain-containing protein [Anaeromyxobacteraceae bacterium]
MSSRAKNARTLSAGAAVVRREGGAHLFLLLRAFRNWDFPKGEVEEGEDPGATARREVLEETGIVDLSFAAGTPFCETPVYGRGKIARYYLAVTETGQVRLSVNPELGTPEHHEYRWVRYSEARTMLVPRLQAVLDWAEELVDTLAR